MPRSRSKPERWWSLLPLLLCGLCLIGPGRAAEDEALALGQLDLQIHAGYSLYALPVANAALARRWTSQRGLEGDSRWADSGQLAYQLAYDYSVVPVRIRIMHRRPEAFAGRVEVVSAHGYHNSEATSGGFVVASREFTVPPSVPVEFTLAPRFCPPSRPGETARLQVRLYQRGAQAPLLFEPRVVQLEPAHLWSLLLDGAPGTWHEQELNPGNRLKLKIDIEGQELDPAIYSSKHYLFACEHQAVTGLPLAARQFAFVVADFAQLQAWPEAEQQALAVYCLGGGRLLLYNAPPGATWQALQLSAAQPLGRGWLLAEPAGLSAAQGRLQAWLEGELQEFTLLAGGTVDGASLELNGFNSFRESGVYLEAVYGVPLVAAGVSTPPLSHRAGFLHPVWLLRMAADRASLEPWDYPEFLRYRGDPGTDNVNLRMAASGITGAVYPRELAELCAGRQPLPRWWTLMLAAAMLGLLFTVAAAPRQVSRLQLPLLLSLLCVALGVSSAWMVSGQPALPAFSLSVQGRAAGLSAACEQRVSARIVGPSGQPQLGLPTGSLVRRVEGNPSGGWSQATANPASGPAAVDTWLAASGGPYTVVRSDNAVAAAASPLELHVVHRDSGSVSIEVEAAGLPEGQLLILCSSLGWQALKTRKTPQTLQLRLPPIPRQPGLARLQALQTVTLSRGVPMAGSRTSQEAESRRLLGQLLSQPWTPELLGNTPSAELGRLGWTALLQDPMLGRGLPIEQIVVFAALPDSPPASGLPERQANWLCQSVALPGWEAQP